VKVFLLAHQDDEIFLLPHILNSEKKLFIYLTTGVPASSTDTKLDIRTSEAEYVFRKYLEAMNSQVIWWGLESSIPEGELHRYVNKDLVSDLKEIVLSEGVQVSALLTTAFEGAHQDHDSVAVITRQLGEIFQVGVIEMSTYPQWLTKFYSFKVLKPGTPEKTFQFNRIKVFFLAIRMMASYRTQLRTWLGLGLATLSVYAFRMYRSSSPGPIEQIKPCFYESRRRASQSEVLRSLNKFN
jgi:LmbE family N-acetylglucosaminyl deacetylase